MTNNPFVGLAGMAAPFPFEFIFGAEIPWRKDFEDVINFSPVVSYWACAVSQAIWYDFGEALGCFIFLTFWSSEFLDFVEDDGFRAVRLLMEMVGPSFELGVGNDEDFCIFFKFVGFSCFCDFGTYLGEKLFGKLFPLDTEVTWTDYDCWAKFWLGEGTEAAHGFSCPDLVGEEKVSLFSEKFGRNFLVFSGG